MSIIYNEAFVIVVCLALFFFEWCIMDFGMLPSKDVTFSSKAIPWVQLGGWKLLPLGIC